MKKMLTCLLPLLVISICSQAQTRYIIQFHDKGTSPYSLSSPGAYLSQRAIDRRTRYGIAIDSTDLPVTPRYVDSIRMAGTVTILNVSKWLNSVSIQTTDAAALSKINSLPFVVAVTPIASKTAQLTERNKFENEQTSVPFQRLTDITANVYNYGSSFNQVHIHNGEFLHNIGLRGQNMVIGMLDAGYQNYLTLAGFDSVRLNGQILGTWDFVAGNASVNEDHAHGEECLSTMACNLPGQMVGTAPGASYYLFRTEDASSEYPVEEHNWVCGAERVDSAGGDMISSSLGYNTFDAPLTSASHTYSDMNGNTTMASKGADLAAKKGLLVVVSAGNEGNSSWHYIVTPADADSAMTVGAVTVQGWAAAFTSLGPSSDGQVKPDLASVGQATFVQFPSGSIGTNNGTSFSCPNLAGLTGCLWQGFPEFNNMKIINALQKAGSRYNNPNDSIGYGIPDVKRALMFLLKDYATSSASVSNCTTTLSWNSKDMSAMKYEVERMLPGQSSYAFIGALNGSGNAFSSKSYQYQDVLNGVNAGNISYRIRQIIDTANASFSADYIDTAVVALSTGCTTTAVDPVISNENTATIVPNPVRDQFELKISSNYPLKTMMISIINEKGQEVARYRKSQPSGQYSYPLSVHHLAAGKYFVVIYNGNKVFATREFIRL